MDLNDKTDKELNQSILAEVSKAQNELRCARGDIDKASARISFCLAALNIMINRGKD